MIRSDQILSTVAMIQEEKLDVRAVTLGVSLLDCRGATPGATSDAVHAKLRRVAGDLVAVCDAASERFGVPITNKRLAVTPVAHIAAGFAPADFVLARTGAGRRRGVARRRPARRLLGERRERHDGGGGGMDRVAARGARRRPATCARRCRSGRRGTA